MPEGRIRRWRGWLATGAAVLLLFLVLVQPNHPDALTPAALARFPLELPVLVIALVLARGGALTALRGLVTGFLILMAVMKLADLGGNIAFLRPFNPVLDMPLVAAAWRLTSGAIGWPLALAAVVALVVAVALLARALWWATGRIARLEPDGRTRLGLAALLVPAVAFAAVDADYAARPFDLPGNAFTSRLAYEHVRDGLAGRADLARFRAEAGRDGFGGLPPARILPDLRGTDVFLIFVESYGRTNLDNPLYAPTITATLAQSQAALAARGLAMRSGFLTAPMVGGQSWFAHSSMLSGLRIDSEGRYRALLASPRRTLLHLGQAAGWRTVAVMPAITLDWPEAGYFGYDTVLAAKDLDYRGRPFNWITMPDQFTLASFARKALPAGPRAPVFAEIALISSHAPWTPIPPLLPWGEVGDGSVFDAYAEAGDPPAVVWRDRDRIRDQYRQAIDYSLRAVFAFAERNAGAAPPLIVVLGDHQPAEFVAEEPGNQDVPVHVIGAPAVLAHLDGWDWTPGLIPRPEVPAWPMEAFRDRFLAAFGTRPAGAPPGVPAAPAPQPRAKG